jgi:hypothetical protein
MVTPVVSQGPPRFLQPQQREKNHGMAHSITAKHSNVDQKGYIRAGKVLS